MSFRSLLAFLLGAGILASAGQAITIDSFTTNQAAVTDPPGTTPTVVTGGADVIGTRRAINTDLLVLPTGLGVGPASTSVSGGALSFSVTGTTPDSRGQGILTWDGDATAGNLNVTGLAGQNLTAGNHNAIRLLVNSASAGSELVVDVYSSATAVSRGFLRIPSAIAAPTSLYLTYAYDFISIAAGPADFSSVGAIQLRVRGTEATVTLDLMDTVGPTLTATKRDLDLANVPIAGPVLEGATLKYRVTVTNSAGGLVEAADLVDTPDTNAPHNATTVRATPVAIDDSYKTPGNVGFAMGSPGLLANDIDPDTAGALPELVIAAASVGTFPTALGGSISVSADGSFTYAPLSGVAHSVDTFTYTLQDNDAQTTTGQVKIAIGPRIWFVDDAHPGTNVGTAGNPFVGFTASNLDGAGGAGDQDAPGDIIFMFAGTLGTGGGAGLELEADQQLLGEGEGLTVDGQIIVAPGTDPVLTSAGHGITLSTNNTLRGFTVGNTGGTSFDLVGSAFGTLTASNLVLNGTGGGLSFTSGTLAATLDSVTSTSGTHGINLDTVVGTLIVTGATTLSDSSFGLRVNNSNTLTVSLNGTASLTTSAGTALFAATGGTLNFSGTANTAVATGGAAIDVTSTSFGAGATFATVSATTAAGKGLNLDNVTGALTGTAGTINISAGGGTAFDINAGASNVTYGGTVTSTAANRLVEVTGRTGGAVTLSGNLNGSGAGHTGINVASNSSGAPTINFSGSSKIVNTGANPAVSLATNTGATINFTGGGLDVDTTSGVGLSATGGAAAVTVQGTGNSLTSTTGIALNVVSTTIGASGLTFQSISSNGAPSGIVLSSTGGSGGLSVTGSSAGLCGGQVGSGPPAIPAPTTAPATGDCTGGTIQASTGAGVSLENTSNVALTRMWIRNSADSGIYGKNVTGFQLTSSLIDNNGTAPEENNIDFGEGASLTPDGLHGTASIASSTLRDGYSRGLSVRNFDGAALTAFDITGSQFRGRAAENNNNDGVFFEALGAASLTVSISNSFFAANKGDHFQAAATNSGDLDIDFTNNTLTGGHSSALGQGITINAALGVAYGAYTGRVDYDINGNNINGASSNGVTVALGTSAVAAVFDGFVRNNVIGTSGVALSCSTQANGVYIDKRGNGTQNSAVTSNTIRRCFDRGILSEAGDGSGVFNLTVQSNIVDQQVGTDSREAIQTNYGITSTNVFSVEDAPAICLQLGGAGALANTFSHGSGAPDDFRLRKRFSATVRLPGYGGGTDQSPASLGQVVTFVQGQNTGSAGEPGSASASGSGGGYLGGAACTLPTL